ncbi:MAG: beta-galactosidase trimerization domain-containing protein [Clostridia bacterium]|nr:beta-galactosidase trimerization domain-containing protein [Clostridia bacterium]
MRCIHLDFHTSPHIDGIGERFDKEKFTKTVKDAKIDLMTVFAKCHHGYTYYPSKVSTMHPGLKFNLLKEEIDAIHEAGAKAPIYITLGWSKKDADEHPEWRHIRFSSNEPFYVGHIPSKNDNSDDMIEECSWTTLCPVGDYLNHLIAITREICENFDVSDGIFYDICFFDDSCACDACRKGMIKMGLDPESHDDAKKYYTLSRINMMKTLTGIVHEYAKDAPVFYNGGAEMHRPEYHPYQTHYELEDLPTAWGGYDLMPIRAKFFEKYGKHFLGMTGKFHHAWGEFGGFKDKEALRYECADMLSVGASISVGDHLHPSGEIDESTYSIIGHAFDYVEKIERFCENSSAYTDLAIWISGSNNSDIGASKLLQIMHLEYDIIGSGDELGKYRCIILPDKVMFSSEDKTALNTFVQNGGSIVASYESIFDELGIEKLAPSDSDKDYIKCDIDEITTPFLAYSKAYKVRHEGEVLAHVYEPYFNRTVGHFCGHKNTPYKPEPADYPALVRCGNVMYFAHPVFEAYNDSGNFVLEKYIIKSIEQVYSRTIVTEEFPSCGRIRLRENKKEGFLALHLLYAPPVNRGNVWLLPDFPKLHGVSVAVKVNRNVTSVVSEPDGTPIPFTQNGDFITIDVPPFSLHKLIIIK